MVNLLLTRPPKHFSAAFLTDGPQSPHGQLQTCSDLCCLFMVLVPTEKDRLWGCLRPCPKCMEHSGDGTCHWVFLWSISLPGWFKQSMAWLYCLIYPWVHRDSDIPTCLCSCRVLQQGECSFGMPLSQRQTERVLEIKLKEDCNLQQGWRQDFERALFVRKTAAFYRMPGMADGKDIWHLELIEWQVGRSKTDTVSE